MGKLIKDYSFLDSVNQGILAVHITLNVLADYELLMRVTAWKITERMFVWRSANNFCSKENDITSNKLGKNKNFKLSQYTRTAGTHYLNFLNQLMAIRSSSGFSHLRPGAFHMFYKYIADITYITESGRKKNKQSQLGLAISVRSEKFGHFSGILCCHERVFEQNSHTATRNADSSRVGWPGFWVHWSQLLLQEPPLSGRRLSLSDANSFLFCSGTWPFFVFFRGKSHA